MIDIYTKKGDRICGKSLLLVIALVIFILGGVMFARSQSENATAIGIQSHIQLELAQQFAENPRKALVTHGSGIDSISPYTALLAGAMRIMSVDLVSLLIPLLLGISTIIFGYMLLRRIQLSDSMTVVTLCILAVSPPFIYTFARSHAISLLILLNVIMVYLLTDTRTKVHYIAIIPALLIFMFGQMHILMTMLIFLVIFYLQNRNRYALACILFALFIVLAYIISPFNTSTLHPDTPGLNFVLQNTISDLGSINGFGVFDVLLLVFGILLCWKNKTRYGVVYLFMILVFLMVLGFDFELTIYLYFISAYFIGIGFAGILRRKWSLSLVGELTVIIVVCGLLFSSIAYVNRSVNDDPHQEYLVGLEALSQLPPGTILSNPEKGHLISVLTGKPVLLHDNYDEGLDSDTIFESRNIETTLELLQKHDVSYIIIDPQMKKGLIWKHENQGLLFLLRNDELFEDIFKNDEIEIYRVTSYRINTY